MKYLSLRIITGILFTTCAVAQNPRQPMLGKRSVALLNSNALQFKDLNKNGKLDPYEDWRLPVEKRVNDLVSQMTLEEKIGFMLISTTRMAGDYSFQQNAPKAEISSGFNEEDLVQPNNMFTRKPLPVPMLSAAGTTKGVTQFHLRHFILRANPSARTIAEWSNNLQALCEGTRLGIPAIVASNPRNHVTIDASIGLSVGTTAFSKWPGELGLAAMRDPKLTREFAQTAAQEWASVGLRKGYMYMADLATEPRWQRVEGTFGEDADLAASMIREIVLGFQGASLNPSSVAMTTKHFPGGGPQVDGQDSHFDWGKFAHYPGGMFDYHVKPFKAAIDAGTSAIMPYYSAPKGKGFEEVGFSYNKAIIQDLLRKKLGFKGIVNSDTGPIDMMPWGVENLTLQQRYQKALDAGVDIFSGTADPTVLLETARKGLVSEARINESVSRLLREKFLLGLFENPYVDVDKAAQLVGSETLQKKADLAHRKSIVLLQNDAKQLPIQAKTKVYFETYYDNGRGGNAVHIHKPAQSNSNLEFVSSKDEADVVLLWLIPTGGSLFTAAGKPIELRLSKNHVDVNHVNELLKSKPTVLAINFSSPWVLDELDASATKTVLATFGTTPDALLDVVRGVYKPTGKLPFTIPASEKAVAENKSDVPGFQEGSDYARFRFGHGLSY
ncbi:MULTISPECIES: glycoside hydrolase family 3 N-terminal domain-containing protein [unclassified Spirosoma]|uniref:glycoside hydrolase family 3 protein n=1 Tax=unclassified Spirosoma TaxID=2621999 RepID=UPI000965CE54|nr:MULTISPECIES: glycoside hydrolase family 3 N-terminal domain-containing protein [unclassified Spirosoma]MBN8826847.1 glycoside hydrolase family 3 C-terminal domain-containing protein [Spirosoma sp.]OJW80336.1 MAG: glycoside hydrolase [Spirosoma sp. 48-14]